MKKISASACILAYNEEENLERCLRPLADFEEILVFDSGSTDRTREIARKMGARVIEGAWEGFGTTRRKLFNEATQTWILWIDADEVASRELVEEMINCVSDDPDSNGYQINRSTFIGRRRVRRGLWYPDWNLRFFRRTAWEMEERDVHESVTTPGTPGRFLSRLDHYSYKNWSDRKKRAERYAKLWASQAFRDGKRATLFDQISHGFGCFVKGYILKLGFLDGITGLRVALSTSAETADKYRRLRRAWTRFGA